MTRQILYVACALRPSKEEIAEIHAIHGQGPETTASSLRISQAIQANLNRAMCWLSWLRRSFPETTFIAPWIASCLAGADDTDPAQRDAGLVDDCAVIERCDGIVLCGPRISDGMLIEVNHGLAFERMHSEFEVHDLTSMGGEAPIPGLRPPGGCSFREWRNSFVRLG